MLQVQYILMKLYISKEKTRKIIIKPLVQNLKVSRAYNNYKAKEPRKSASLPTYQTAQKRLSSSSSKGITEPFFAAIDRTGARQIGQAATFISHESMHLMWNTWPQAESFLHHWASLKASRQTTQSSRTASLDRRACFNLKRGRALRSLEGRPEEEGEEARAERLWRWRWWERERWRRSNAAEAKPRKRKKREVRRAMMMALRNRDSTLGFGFGGGDWFCWSGGMVIRGERERERERKRMWIVKQVCLLL